MIFAVVLWSYRRSHAVFRFCIAALALVMAAGMFADAKIAIFFGITFYVMVVALVIGGPTEREAVIMSYVLMLIPYFAAIYMRGTNKEFDPIGALVDCAFMIWLGVIAHRHDRFWAYFASACFALAVAGHLMAFINPDFAKAAYLQMRFLPGGLMIFMLLGGALWNRAKERKSSTPLPENGVKLA